MNPERFFVPSYMGMRNVPMAGSMLGMTNSIPRGMGLFSRITSGIRSVNWGNLLNNANRTLDVVNQAIPLVRQAGPMVNNMKSMLRIAKAFGSETTNIKNTGVNNNNRNRNNSVNINGNNIDKINSYQDKNLIKQKEVQDSNAPNFFI